MVLVLCTQHSSIALFAVKTKMSPSTGNQHEMRHTLTAYYGEGIQRTNLAVDELRKLHARDENIDRQQRLAHAHIERQMRKLAKLDAAMHAGGGRRAIFFRERMIFGRNT